MEINLQEAFCVLLDNWYLQEKEKLKGSGQHHLGLLKETVKSQCCVFLQGLEIYVEKLKRDRGIKQ